VLPYFPPPGSARSPIIFAFCHKSIPRNPANRLFWPGLAKIRFSVRMATPMSTRVETTIITK